ncbi:ABC transporter ATP-binding protein [Streptacidiphilus sp. P02-A3a]|uniref:dipeptide ABC transporter ATP-binding protein n=1 Tax=Streptacidiphilus sp. P02-A3a TaxID=2704468 RepID=UPI0015FAAD3D|nr:ABC transporter ATP-binding protein [Streptacidiphilus sp. P02-A3a]QMU71150.1 ABC transporter ATP-binding protein [Streptacidiphilus sp. P02-A3a]
MSPTPEPLLAVEDLNVVFQQGRSARRGQPQVNAVRDVSFTLDRGECLAVVGESGSGKSVTARTLLGLTGNRAQVTARRISFDGQDLTALSEREWRSVRGRRIGLVLQDALVSLDPLRRIGTEVGEPLRTHGLADRAETGRRVLSLLADAGIPDPARRARQYPHQLSGGLRQRALIASALAGGPELLVADEPTTALDVTVQAQVFDLLSGLIAEGTALLLISHDLAAVARLADRIAVMYGGLVVERGPAARVLGAPRHPYTRALLAAVPAIDGRRALLSAPTLGLPAAGPDGCPYAARCALADQRCRDELPAPEGEDGHQTRCWHPRTDAPVALPTPVRALPAEPAPAGPGPAGQRPDGRDPAGEPLLEVSEISKRFRSPDGGHYDAVREVSFQLRAGETLGVVGESGSGKTTAARIALGLLEPDSGSVRFAGGPWSGVPEHRRRERRRLIQVVSQDPLGSFDPRYSVERLVGEAVAQAGIPRGAARRARVAELLDQVGLPAGLLDRRPLDLSGGQRQRVAIARALAPGPRLLVCDEPVSALDVSIQAQVLDLLVTLQRELGVALLFISHDLGVIHHVSDRLIVMRGGSVVETGDVAEVFAGPAHPYTRELLAAVPRPEPAAEAVPHHRDRTPVAPTPQGGSA